MSGIRNKEVDGFRRKLLLGGLAIGATSLLQACGGESGTSTAQAGASGGPSLLAGTTVVTPAPIPTTQVKLSDFGGVAGASASTIKNAFNQAFTQLKNAGGGTLVIDPGTYHLGDQPSEVIVMGVDNLKNVLISAYGAKLTMNTTASTGMPVFLHFTNPNNVTVAGLSFYDFGTNLNINWKGAVCLSVNTTTACSGFKTVDCLAENVGTFWRSMPSTKYTLTNCDISGTVKTAYYGVNCNFNGRFSKCNLVCEKVRRAFIAYGTRDWEITVRGSSASGALGSNAFISLTPDATAPVENVKVNLTMSGNVSPYGGLVHIYHQGVNTSPQYARNVKAHLVLDNVTGTAGSAFLFDHEPPPGGVILSSTIRTFEEITLTGKVIGTYNGPLIRNPSVSTGSPNLISVASNLATIQNASSIPMKALPSYFKVFTPAACSA